MQFVSLILFSLGLAVAHANTAGGFDCINKPTGVYPNVEDCTTFYKCSNGFTYLYDCPAGLHFDSISLNCLWPHEAKCATGGCDDGKGPGWWNGKDCNGHNHGDLYPDPYDCESFYQCSWGTAYSFKCAPMHPSGRLHFNNKIKVCDWPVNAKCKEECPPKAAEPNNSLV